ncbi:uncharacterized protein TNIN_398841 [Trichonephila inaurata madagascariensis]|uniref:Uncharacterized protein n=1 Tax=Trichonephila inaurata madagascariensis TaxID=2747483 RepID=A0A8X7CR36_9ARAC|nr:uncharacterized protein TNIN_398841 [Trichonephila inaurata madagascariensis]
MVFTIPMLSLRQLALLKVATLVCDDTKIKNFLREHGSVSFVFPRKEGLVFMDVTEAVNKQGWIPQQYVLDCTPIKGLKDLSHFLHPYNADPKFASTNARNPNLLPFCKWEDLVEEKLLSFLLPRHLFPPVIEMTRIVSMEIDKWVKELSLVLERSAEIAHTSQRYFQWNSLAKIDRIKTARNLIINEGSNIEDLYILACALPFDG